MLDESRKARRQRIGHLLRRLVRARAAQQQRSGIIVNAITVVAVRYIVDSMLKQAGVVTHRDKMLRGPLRKGGRLARALPEHGLTGDPVQRIGSARRRAENVKIARRCAAP